MLDGQLTEGDAHLDDEDNEPTLELLAYQDPIPTLSESQAHKQLKPPKGMFIGASADVPKDPAFIDAVNAYMEAFHLHATTHTPVADDGAFEPEEAAFFANVPTKVALQSAEAQVRVTLPESANVKFATDGTITFQLPQHRGFGEGIVNFDFLN